MIHYLSSCLVVIMTMLQMSASGRHRQSYQAYSAGNCPHVRAMADFEMDRFVGKWYVVRKFPAKSECVEETFAKQTNDKYVVHRSSKPIGFSRTSFVNVTSELQAEHVDEPSRMVMLTRFQDAVINRKRYVVLGTDYDNYAVVWSCVRKLIGHRQSLQVMARSDKLRPSVVFELRELLAQFNTRENDLIPISHAECTAPARPVAAEDKPVTSGDKPDKPSVNQVVKPDVNIIIGPIHINSQEDQE